MRDLLIMLLVFGSIPAIFMRPWIGIIVWCWLGFMNPHRLTWGFAYDFPFALVIALVTFLAIVFSKEKKHLEMSSLTVVWLAWIFWMNVTSIFALDHDVIINDYDRSMKIQLFSILTAVLINSRERLNALVWVTVLSLGFFGLKGGLFSVLTGGNNLVWGPPGSFIEGNNALGLALVMTLPLMQYQYAHSTHKYIRLALLGGMALTALAVLTTHSRGAFLALGGMFGLLWLKSDRKVLYGIFILILGLVLLGFMPEKWVDRMWSIGDYQTDGSAQGRINAWWFAFNLATDHPFTGGGFGTFTRDLFLRYAPNPADFHDAHSIYFEVLGEHGFVGIGIFLILGAMALLTAGSTIRMCHGRQDLKWAADLARVIQVSLAGYAIGGAFLGLAYFDLYYHFIAMIVVVRMLAMRQLAQTNSEDGSASGTEPSASIAPKRARIGDRFTTTGRG